MPNTIDELQIEINAKATKANDAIDRLVGKLDRLSTSLGRMNFSNLNNLANGVNVLGKSMQTMNNIKTSGFARLAGNLAKLSTINVSSLYSTANSLSHLLKAFNALGPVSANAQQVGVLAANLSKLGGANIQRAIVNIPLLASSLSSLMATLSKAPAVSQNVIQMTNAMANLASQGSKVGTASNSMVKGLNRASTSAQRAKKSFGGLASAIGRFYATYFLVMRGIKGLWRSIESTADYIEAFNYFNVALGKIGSDWAHEYEKYGYESADAYADSFANRLQDKLKGLSGVSIEIAADGNGLLTDSGLKNLGLNIQEVTQYASQLASVTNSVGQTGEVSLATASAFSKLGADMSSLFNLDYSDVMRNLQSGLIGQSRALYKYGIDITNATLQTYAYELGLGKAVSEMTQAEKMQLRMIAILDQSKVSWGDLANTINSPSNMIRQFTNNLKETGMILGQLFIPLLQKVMPIINGVTIAIKRLLESIAGFLGIKLDLSSFGQGYTDLEDGVEDLTGAYDDATAAAKKLKTATLGIDELNINAPQEDTGNVGGAVGGGIDLTDEILKATEEYEKAWADAFAQMENKANAFADKIEKILEPIKSLFRNLFSGNFYEAGQDLSGIVSGIFDFFSDAIGEVDWEEIGRSIGEFLDGIEWKDVFLSVGNFFKTLFDAAVEAWSAAFEEAPLETIIITTLAGMKFLGIGKPSAKDVAASAGGIVDKVKQFGFGATVAGGLANIGNVVSATPAFAHLFAKVEDKYLRGTFLDTSTWKGPFKVLNDFISGSIALTGDLMVTNFSESLESVIGKNSELFSSVGYFFGKIGEDFKKGDWWAVGVDIVSGIVGGITAVLYTITVPFQLLFDWIYRGVNDLYNYFTKLLGPVAEFLGLSLETTDVVGGLQKVVNESNKELTEFTNDLSNGFDKVTVSLGLVEESTLSFGGNAEKTINDVENTISEFLGNSSKYEEKSISLGENIASGISTGIENMVETIRQKVTGIADMVQNTLKTALDIHSPSRVMFDLGTYTMEGYKDGVESLYSPIYSSLSKFGNGIPMTAPSEASLYPTYNYKYNNVSTIDFSNSNVAYGVKQGVREAVSEILAPYLSDIAQNTRETANKDLSVNIGDRDIARANARGQRSLGASLIV